MLDKVQSYGQDAKKYKYKGFMLFLGGLTLSQRVESRMTANLIGKTTVWTG